AAATVRRELFELLRSAAADDDIVGLEGCGEAGHDVEHGLAPLLLALPREHAFGDVVLERLLPIREMSELERLDDAVRDQRRPEAGADPEEEHPAAVTKHRRLDSSVLDSRSADSYIDLGLRHAKLNYEQISR